MATGATPGRASGFPSPSWTRTMSPSAKTSGCPGSVRSGATETLPALSRLAPLAPASGARRQLLGERAQQPVGGLHKHDLGGARVDAAEVAPQRVVGDFADLAR